MRRRLRNSWRTKGAKTCRRKVSNRLKSLGNYAGWRSLGDSSFSAKISAKSIHYGPLDVGNCTTELGPNQTLETPTTAVVLRLSATSRTTDIQMTPEPTRIPADRLLLATISVMRTLIGELGKRGIIDPQAFIQTVQETAVAHRQAGDPNHLADAIHAISVHLDTSLPDAN